MSANKILKNSLAGFISSNITKVISLVVIVLIARFLGEVDYGKFTFVLTLTSIFGIGVDWGIRTLMVRTLSRKPDLQAKYFSNIIIFKSINSLIMLSLIGILGLAMYTDSTTLWALFLAGLVMITESFLETAQGFYQSQENLMLPSQVKVIRAIVRAGLVVPILFMGYGILSILAAYIIAQLVGLIILYLKLYMDIKPKWDFDIPVMIQVFKESLPFALSALLVLIYFRIDIVMLSWMQGDAIVGNYAAAYNLIDATLSIPIAFAAAVLPVASKLYTNNKEKFQYFIHDALRIMILVGLPASVGLCLTAPQIITLLYGQQYDLAPLTLQILGLSVILMFIVYVLGIAMIAIHKEKIALYILLANALTNIVFNLILIPQISLFGAALATVLTEILYLLGYYVVIKKHMGSLPWIKSVKPLIASLGMGVITFLLLDVHVLLNISISAVVYMLLLLLLKEISGKDKQLIYSFISRN